MLELECFFRFGKEKAFTHTDKKQKQKQKNKNKNKNKNKTKKQKKKKKPDRPTLIFSYITANKHFFFYALPHMLSRQT